MATEPSPEPQQVRHWVADRLRDDIMNGRLKPGEWLRQERLARDLGVSQMPVREALKQLAAEGLVEHQPYHGARVVELSADDVEDLYFSRAVLEGMAARHAARRMTAAELAEIEDLHRRMVACVTPAELPTYRALNRQFHTVICTASRRPYLARTLAGLWAAFPAMVWNAFAPIALASVAGRDEPDAEEHEAIVKALRAGDPAAAERAVRRHVQSAGTALVKAMRAQAAADPDRAGSAGRRQRGRRSAT